ncbi:hypothetical protein K2173_009977 [Erythroxylum novogranatense]|uniref:DUF4378 domain-containing protein n=1 Tax=Erythroxylum novogranatense TaxID=1862640 RepID=A0AAV8SZH7_9ROSI|nr:hypothetical protein K2173_009977 [Erythroxylum novogranatense]
MDEIMSEMSNRNPASSVIARLMGIDEVPYQQPAQKKPRVLSENYLRRVASIGVREKFPEDYPSSLSMEKYEEPNFVFQVLETLKRDKHHGKSSGRKKVKLKSTGVSEDKNLQIPLKCSDASEVPDSLTGKYPWKLDYLVKDKINDPAEDNFCLQLGVKDFSLSFTSGCGHGCICRKCMNENLNADSQENIYSMVNGRPRRQLLRSESVQSYGSCIPASRKVLQKPNPGKAENAPRNLSYHTSSPQVSCLGLWRQEEILVSGSRNVCLEVKERKRTNNGMLITRPKSRFLKDKARRLMHDEDRHLELNRCTILVKDGYSSSCASEKSVHQDVSKGAFEEDCANSQWSGTDPESRMGLEESRYPSPVSVLDPFCKNDPLSSSDCLRSDNFASLPNLNMQLELLNSEASDSYSEESGMAVSSDAETGEGSIGDSGENEDIMRSFKAEECRDFSYLVDVLTEAGFHSEDLHIGFDSYRCEEYPISYTIFETLEKKYGGQLSWNRSERRLLFDRINSVLKEILEPSGGLLRWTIPVARRFNVVHGQEVNEDELWKSLVSQEKQAGDECLKFFGKEDRWLVLVDEVEVIGREIEDSLVDELVEECS